MSTILLEPGAPAEPAGTGTAPAGAAAQTRRSRAAARGPRTWLRPRAGIWLLRLPLLTPFVLMAPEFYSLALHRPEAAHHVSLSAADVLGMSALLFMFVSLTVTPLHTVTGWKWHRSLRRDYGLGMFAVALTDFVCAATVTGDQFQGGLVNRIAGHTFLLAGTLSTFLLVPLALTASRRAQRWLGPHWKWLHRLIYVIWALVLLHLAFLFAFRTLFIDSLLVSAPLAVLRLPALRDRWVAARKARSHRAVRWTSGLVMLGVYGVGFTLLTRELVNVGLLALQQNPSS
jgi:methionine sulfoxide reductase heme-binding subunit